MRWDIDVDEDANRSACADAQSSIRRTGTTELSSAEVHSIISLRVAFAMFFAPLIVPAYVMSVSGAIGSVVHVLLLGVVAQALAFVSGYIVAALGWKLSALKATAVGATVEATVPIGLALAWQASEMLDGIPVLTVLGAVVGFLYWVIAWWEPARR